MEDDNKKPQVIKEGTTETLYLDSLSFELNDIMRVAYDPHWECFSFEHRIEKFPGQVISVELNKIPGKSFILANIVFKWKSFVTYLINIKDAIFGRDNTYASHTELSYEEALKLANFIKHVVSKNNV